MNTMLSGHNTIYTADTPGVTWLQAQFALFLVFRSALSPNTVCLRRELMKYKKDKQAYIKITDVDSGAWGTNGCYTG